MDEAIRVVVSGAGGRMGREVVNAVLEAGPELALVGAADPAFAGNSISEALGADSPVIIERSLECVLESTPADVVVVFSVPAAAMGDIRAAMKAKAVPVVGTTGITAENLQEVGALAAGHGVGAIIAPNFAMGAVLMMKLAGEVAKYLPAVEIIELHHDKKLDAPSGTAVKTAEMIASARQGICGAAPGDASAARGGDFHGVRIHSVRLPGLVAHQEVIFGGLGQTLTIRHDSYDRKSFMPGVLLAIRKARGLTDVIYGLENII
ncbi:MAG TPA: 4-hydroxy-tetrahydrodipicolinate reductase [Armatimonadota bacterium]|nr:4-hydroxy-tetrahydrodipicolinate reductase [Armatimonadota bacterium]